MPAFPILERCERLRQRLIKRKLKFGEIVEALQRVLGLVAPSLGDRTLITLKLAQPGDDIGREFVTRDAFG